MPTTYRTSSGRERWKANWRDALGAQHSKNFDDHGSALRHEEAQKLERDAQIGTACATESCENPVEQTGVGPRRRFCRECAERRHKESEAQRKRNRPGWQRPVPTPCKNPDCDEMVEQTGVGAPKKYHSDKCREDDWNDKKRRPDPVPRSRLSEVNTEDRTAVCSLCGPTRLYRIADRHPDGRPRVRWRCIKCVKEQTAESKKRFAQSEKGKDMRMRGRYGLTREELVAAKRCKTDLCDCCGRHTDVCGELVYEHCHDEGHWCGWTCGPCNLMLGNADHDPERLEAGARYLRRTRRKS